MTDWSITPHLWQCDMCAVPIMYSELHQQVETGVLACRECYEQWVGPSDTAPTEPRLCEECGASIIPLRSVDAEWRGEGEKPQLCRKCSVEPPPTEMDEAIEGMIKIIEETAD